MNFQQVRDCVNKIIYGKGVKSPESLRIKKMLGVISSNNVYSSMYDLVNDLTIYILTPGEYTGVTPISKFDEDKAGLQKFVEYQTLGFLSGKVRKKVNYDIPQINNADLGEDDSDFLNSITSKSSTPEEILLGKELANYIIERLGEDGKNVLLKEETNEDAAIKLGVTKQAFNRKHLRRIGNMKKNYKNINRVSSMHGRR